MCLRIRREEYHRVVLHSDKHLYGQLIYFLLLFLNVHKCALLVFFQKRIQVFIIRKQTIKNKYDNQLITSATRMAYNGYPQAITGLSRLFIRY